ncbi:hypothetical protein TUSST3_61920 [Streptomyces sp. TUS-ST3]|nr:hypothetical protein TUSST3_61920 [Streptomyces sp. TUS-ST3]
MRPGAAAVPWTVLGGTALPFVLSAPSVMPWSLRLLPVVSIQLGGRLKLVADARGVHRPRREVKPFKAARLTPSSRQL